MRTGVGLLLIAVGAILAFAVTTNTSVFNLHTAGYVLILVGILGFVLPRRATGWMGRRLVRSRQGGRQVITEDVTYESYATPKEAAEADLEAVKSGDTAPDQVPTKADGVPVEGVPADVPPGTDYISETYETDRER